MLSSYSMPSGMKCVRRANALGRGRISVVCCEAGAPCVGPRAGCVYGGGERGCVWKSSEKVGEDRG